MPSLQLLAPRTYDADTKRLLAQRMGRAYAESMQTTPEIVTVAVHDLGEGGVWRCTAGQPIAAALLMCDIRIGRSVETRAALAEELITICVDTGGLLRTQIKVEFTQHAGEDMYHPHLGGFNHDWTVHEG